MSIRLITSLYAHTTEEELTKREYQNSVTMRDGCDDDFDSGGGV